MLALLAIGYLVVLSLCALLAWLGPWPGGLVGMIRIFLPQLALPLLVTVPILWRRKRWRWLPLAPALLVLGLCPPAFSPRKLSEGAPWSALTWNARGNVLDLPHVDVLALQEVDWQLVAPEAEHYEHSWFRPGDGVPPAMALLSRYPIRERGVLEGQPWDIPRVMWARLAPPGGPEFTVINIHPIPPYEIRGRLPWLEPELRDRQITALRRDLIDPLLQRREPFVVLGDCNVCEREPAYLKLSHQLQDGFRVSERGYQTTWAPALLASRGIGLLRLDYLLASPELTVLQTGPLDSARGSDHFPVAGSFQVWQAKPHPSQNEPRP